MKECLSLCLHVFSGTGNSLRAAHWLAEGFGWERSRLVRIGRAKAPVTSPAPDSLTGFIFPTHGFTAPCIVLRHALRMPRTRRAPAFIIASRAGTWPGFLLPGLSGNAMYLVALILLCKGYHIRGLRGLDMPSNWMSLHWGLSQRHAAKIIARGKRDIEKFAGKIFAGRRHLLSLNNLLELVLGIAFFPISAAYLILGRFCLAKLFYANWRCTGCGQCARDCPVGGIILKGNEVKRPFWTFACESCMHCMGYCPEKAVETSHPLAIVFYYTGTFSLAGALSAWLMRSHLLTVSLQSAFWFRAVHLLINYGYMLLSFFLVYWLFYHLVRIPALNRLFTSLTLTHYYRRYHEPGMIRKDF